MDTEDWICKVSHVSDSHEEAYISSKECAMGIRDMTNFTNPVFSIHA